MTRGGHYDEFEGEAMGKWVAEREAIALLLQKLLHVAGSHADRLEVLRAVDEARGEEMPSTTASSAILPDSFLAWLEDAAERLDLRLTIQRLPLKEALSFASKHLPATLVSTVSPSESWVCLQRQSWGKWEAESPRGEKLRLKVASAAELLKLTSPSDDVWFVSPALARPYSEEDDHPPGGTFEMASHGGGHGNGRRGHGHEGHGGHGHAGGHGHSGGHNAGGHGGGHGHGHDHMSPWMRLLSILRPDTGDIAVVAIFSAVVGLLSLASPIAVEALVNTVAFGRFLQPVVVLSLILLTFLAFAATLRIVQAYISEIIQRRIFVRVVSDLAYRLPRVRQSAFDEHHGPELMNRFFDVMTVQKTAAVLVLDGIAMVLQTVIGMVVLGFYHNYLIGFDLFLIACLAVIVFVLGRGSVRSAIAESYAKYHVAAWLEQLADAPIAFKTAQGSRFAWDVADRLTTDYVRARTRHFRVLMRQIVFAVGLQAAGSALLLGLGGWLVITGDLSLGQLVAAEMIVAVILNSFAKLGKQLESFYDLMAAVDKIGHLFDLPVERTTGVALGGAARSGSAGETPAGPALGVSLRRVSYDFEGAREVVHGVSLEVRPGEFVALTGPPGSGKSVVLDLLYGLRQPSSGRLEVGGMDLRGVQPASLRRQVALVRDGGVIAGTILENVQMARPEVGLGRVREALTAVGLWDEVLESPQGLDTRLDPDGRPMTHSQTRRLLLARAIAGRPRLLLVDEIIDALPTSLANSVLAILRQLTGECTVVIVTGRDDIAAACPRVEWLSPDGGRPSPAEMASAH
ncbi:MAG: ABC transporter ATP-binding protein [Pirellulales bacterium]